MKIAPRAVQGFGFQASGMFRVAAQGPAAGADPQLERADLHALLIRGPLSVVVRGRRAELGPAHLFLVAEQLLVLADDVLEAWQTARPVFRRLDIAGARLALRRGPGDGPLSVSIGGPDVRDRGEQRTFPEVPPAAFVQSSLRFARQLAQAFVQYNPSQQRNLRLAALLSTADSLEERADDTGAEDALTNPEPESYRSFPLPRRRSESRGLWEHGGRMRFVPRWVATVPNINLRATFLCGDALIVGSARETACIQRSDGNVVWRIPTPRAASVVTPSGLARLSTDGRIALHKWQAARSASGRGSSREPAEARREPSCTLQGCRSCSWSPRGIAASRQWTWFRAMCAGGTRRSAPPATASAARASCCSWRAATRPSSLST